MIFLDFYLQRSSSWLKILMVEKLIVKNLSTLYGLYDNSLLMGAPPHMAILPGYQGGIFGYLISDKV